MSIRIRQYITLLSKYLKRQKLRFFYLTIVLVVSIVLQIINPQIVRSFIDTAMQNGVDSVLIKMAALYIAIALLQQLFSLITTYLAQKVGWKATNALREDLVDHCMNLDMSFHKDRRPGELIEIIDGDTNVLFNFFSRMGVTVISNIILVVGVLMMYFREDYRIGLAQTAFCAVSAWALVRAKDSGTKHWKKNRELYASFFGFVGESISNTEDVKANGAKGYVMHRLHKQLKEWYPIRMKSTMASRSLFLGSLTLQVVGFAISFLMGTYLWKQGAISIGTVYLFYSYTINLNRPILTIQRQLQDMQSADASIHRIEELLNRESMIKDSKNDCILDEQFDLSIQHITFGYDEDADILKDISLKVESGKTIALLGRTGSGKTTLARLLIRFYDVNKGEIKLGNMNIKDIPISELRKRVAYVTQDVQLFNGTIRENLTFYNKNIEDSSILKAIEEIGLGDWFSKFPDGLNTVLGVGGIGLSAGESQLLAFVRVFLKNPYMIILDEVSSRLDPETERQLQTAIAKLLKGRIGVIIAHRIWTINFVDDIIILENGRMIEYGMRERLEQDLESQFYKLLKSGLQEVVA